VNKSNEEFDPGAQLCGHGNRTKRAHYLGGGLWVCFECLAKLLVGGRKESPRLGPGARGI